MGAPFNSFSPDTFAVWLPDTVREKYAFQLILA
jgi:hypothetical protein